MEAYKEHTDVQNITTHGSGSYIRDNKKMFSD